MNKKVKNHIDASQLEGYALIAVPKEYINGGNEYPYQIPKPILNRSIIIKDFKRITFSEGN